MQEKVSVIVPIGNRENFLEKTLKSIQNQTLRDIEIICIDDATEGKCRQIIENFQRNDSRVKVKRMTEHQGAAVCRNAGLELGQAPYVIFLDSDDLFEKDMLELLYQEAEKYDADMAIAEYDTFIAESDLKDEKIELYKVSPYTNPFSMKTLEEKCLLWNMAPWNKLIRREFLQKWGLHFQKIDAANDVYFSLITGLLSEKIVHTATTRPLIHYRTNMQGQISSTRLPIHCYSAFLYLKKDLVSRNCWEEFSDIVRPIFLKCILAEIRTCRDNKAGKFSYELLRKEGIREFGLDTSDRYKEVVNKINNQPYEDRWYKTWSAAGAVLKTKKQKVNQLGNYIGRHNGIAGLFGAGIINKTLLDEINQSAAWNLVTVIFIDNDKKKQGTKLNGSEVISMEAAAGYVDYIIITNKDFFPAVYNQLKRRKITTKLFLLYAYLYDDCTIEEALIEIKEL